MPLIANVLLNQDQMFKSELVPLHAKHCPLQIPSYMSICSLLSSLSSPVRGITGLDPHISAKSGISADASLNSLGGKHMQGGVPVGT